MNAHQDEPAEVNFEEFGFIYTDYPYFNWFRQETEDTLKAVWIWKGLHRGATRFGDGGMPLEEIWNGQGFVVDAFDGLPLITRAFLHHLHEPEQFPILDRYVWFAMCQMNRQSSGQVPANPTHWDRHYRQCYMPFFKNLYEKHGGEIMNVPQIAGVDDAIVRRRVLDRALWVYGKRRSDKQTVFTRD